MVNWQSVKKDCLRKKKAEKRYREQDEEKVDEFKKKLSQISKKELIYLDESGIQSSLVQQYFWMKKGDKKVFKTSGKRGLKLNVLAALTSDGIKAPFLFDTSCNRDIFELYIKEILSPILEKGKTIIMDNASFHKSEKIKTLIESAGCELVYLPPYSPELNPIEKYWAVLKGKVKLLRKKIKCLVQSVEEGILATLNFGKHDRSWL